MPPSDDISNNADRILLEHLVRGMGGEPEQAYTKIDSQYRNSLIRYAMERGCATREVAEDCTQNVLLKLWEKRNSLSPDTMQLANYLHQSVYNCVLSSHKHENMKAKKSELLLSTATNILRAHPGPDQEYETRETSGVLGKALGNLEPRMRDAFRMKYGKGLSHYRRSQR
jgi:RNA polymerase sigma factor (sigma-70 family)